MASFEIKYSVRYIIHEPCEDTMDMWMAEIPDLPGCRVWVEDRGCIELILRGVAWQHIDALLENGHEVPKEIQEAWYKPEDEQGT